MDHLAEFGLEMLIDVHAQESNKSIGDVGLNCECADTAPNIKQQIATTNHINNSTCNTTGASLRDPQLACLIHDQEMSWPGPIAVQPAMNKMVLWKVQR